MLVVEDASWRAHRGILPALRHAAEAARKAARLPASSRLTILLADDARLKALNHEFRGKNKPTNVLSFPSGDKGYAGDIALAYGVTHAEALAAKKAFADHALHLVVHGVLHLGGYDHITARHAKVMEPLETKILAKLGVPDPWEHRPGADSGSVSARSGFPSGRATQNKQARN